jgi:long-chain acyl-CoA synthetase
VRRNFVAEKYGVLIDALYGGKSSQFIETAVKFEDGRQGKVSADLDHPIVKTFPVVRAASMGKEIGEVILDLQNISLPSAASRR